ncbi:MAG: glycosyltransferase family 2 protein [Thermoflavifilum sp.]|nr:glycosyltransferase family 2 protein [Thermoflavifilum sp.]
MQPAQPLISVLMPYYQTVDFLEEAIHSVMAQTYREWELLLIDDGATDGSQEIARHWAETYPDRIRLLTHPDGGHHGLPATRNLGLAQAKGAYTALLDADDVWLPEKLEHQITLATRYPHCALFGEASLYWYSWQHTGGTDTLIYPGITLDEPIDPPRAALELYPLGTGAAPCPSSLLMNTAVLRELGGFETAFSGPYMVYEDQALLAKFYLQKTVFFSSSCLNRYRQRPQSLVSELHQRQNYWQIHRYFLKWLEQYVHTHCPDPDPRILQAIRRAKRKSSIWQRALQQVRAVLSVHASAKG